MKLRECDVLSLAYNKVRHDSPVITLDEEFLLQLARQASLLAATDHTPALVDEQIMTRLRFQRLDIEEKTRIFEERCAAETAAYEAGVELSSVTEESDKEINYDDDEPGDAFLAVVDSPTFKKKVS